ncbi:bacteriocin [Tepidibacter formicigenes]|jgi:bacteriocin-like protein|nr:bacteriocin [Tepidibacter formicigenes]
MKEMNMNEMMEVNGGGVGYVSSKYLDFGTFL